MKYITKIRANLSIYTKRKTSNILEGVHHSVYKGKSLNFEDLREYVVGDNIKDIDWKASSRANKILVKQYIAEKKHNILFILDSGKKMLADTEDLESKKELALMTAGTISYLVNQNGDSISAICNSEKGIKLFPFQTGLYHIERILSFYEKNMMAENNLNQLIQYVIQYIRRKMIIFVVTDIGGINSISKDTLKKLSLLHDVMFVNISDALMTGIHSYDMDEDDYIPDFILEDSKMKKNEIALKEKIKQEMQSKFKKYKIFETTISKQSDIVLNILKLLERRKYAN